MTDPQSPPFVLTPSERVLLFGDRFTPQVGMLGTSEVVLTSGVKVDADKLAAVMLAAAFLANEQAGALGLEARQGKAMFGLMKTEHLHAVPGQKQVGWPNGSLEQVVARSVAAQPKVDDLVSGIIQDRSPSPGQALCQRAKIALAARDVVHAEEKKTLKIFTSVVFSLPDASRAAAEQSGWAHVQQMLQNCEQQRPQLWNALMKNIRASITWMTQTNDP